MSEFISNLLEGDHALIAAGAIYFAVCGVLATGNAIRLSRWPSVVGKLNEAEVGRTSSLLARTDEQEYAGRVRYSYSVDGERFEGERLSPFPMMATYNARFAIRWRLGWIERIGDEGVRVYHHPTKPQKSHLIGVGWRMIGFTATLTFGASAVLIAALL